MKPIRVLITILAAGLMGCMASRGFNRGELREEMNGPVSVTDQDIEKTLALKPQLPHPFRLGLFFKEPENRNRFSSPKWFWSEDDKNRVLALTDRWKATKEVSDVFVISDATVSKTDIKSLRLAAAQHGADALLVITGISDLDSYTNGWAWAYIALVPALFVPGSVNDGLFMARAAMWDVRNEYLYLTADSESLKKQVKPAAFTDERKVIEEAKQEALYNLGDEITKMLVSPRHQTASAKY